MALFASRQFSKSLFSIFAAAYCALSIVGCATTEKKTVLAVEEVIRGDQQVSQGLTERFESQLKFKQETEVTVYLRSIAESLISGTSELQGAPVGVWLVDTKKEKWNSYSLPGNRIYLSLNSLRRLQFENEVAALIALELGHLVKKHFLLHLEEALGPGKNENPNMKGLVATRAGEYIRKMDYFGPSGVFSFNEEEDLEAIEAAVGILYRAGYDARGLISVLQLYQNNLRHSPYDLSSINKYIEHARQEVAQFAPLRNPIVRTQAFLLIQKRIQRL